MTYICLWMPVTDAAMKREDLGYTWAICSSLLSSAWHPSELAVDLCIPAFAWCRLLWCVPL